MKTREWLLRISPNLQKKGDEQGHDGGREMKRTIAQASALPVMTPNTAAGNAFGRIAAEDINEEACCEDGTDQRQGNCDHTWRTGGSTKRR